MRSAASRPVTRRRAEGMTGIGHSRPGGRLLSLSLVLLTSRALGAAPCPPAAEVAGDMELVEQVGQELGRRGIAVGAPASLECNAVLATVTRGDSTLHVVIDDQGRRSERDVGSLDAAVALIESWARTDLPDLLLSRQATPRKVTPPPLVVTDLSSPLPSSFTLALAVDVALSDDGANWGGAAFSGCAAYGPVCALFTARWSVSSVRSLHPEHRTDLDALLGVRVPLRWGLFTLGPSLSVGVGWLRSSRAAFELEKECSGGPDDVCVGTEIPAATANATSLRTEAGVLLSLSPTEHVGVDFTIGLTVAPLSKDHLLPDDALTLPEPVIPLSGEPRWALRTALGVHWSGP